MGQILILLILNGVQAGPAVPVTLRLAVVAGQADGSTRVTAGQARASLSVTTGQTDGSLRVTAGQASN